MDEDTVIKYIQLLIMKAKCMQKTADKLMINNTDKKQQRDQ